MPMAFLGTYQNPYSYVIDHAYGIKAIKIRPYRLAARYTL